ncbi:MAG TPA: hypothetical protein VFP16_10540, partial [Vicinamibacterales bacterium]|nr:hypothetical protein [Vicinamibacterales bacterium]
MAARAQRFSKVFVAASLALVGAAGISNSGAAGQEPTAKRSIKDGVYTEVQANRGEREYGRTCEHCHGAGLEGDTG